VIKKKYRFSGRSEFLEVKNKGGVVFDCPLFGVVGFKKEDKEIKLGWIISKKISKKAVERNKIKRRLSVALESKIDSLAAGTRIIFLVKKEILGKSVKEIEMEVDKLVVKMGK
jgi:ribonuclease P protein component